VELKWIIEDDDSERGTLLESLSSGDDIMFCIQCGRAIDDASSFCSSCGARQRARTSHKQLTLSATDKKLAGVCGGIAEYLDVDPTIVRLIWVALSVVPGGFVGGALAYFLAWIIIPKAPAFASAAAGTTAVQPSPKAG
jgi:phage shock protein PspC (stress-responsive transcriptional regulator)